ncbi:MAG TPA: PAS domain S-box protein [Xanthobacteraceae bacterium]|nr:PAS domain S-box protein [Xanthobacteraceae bacterium]
MTTPPTAEVGGRNECRQTSGGDGTAQAFTSDLLKVLDAVGVPILVLRRDFIVACFNSAAAEVLSLAPSDIGRAPRAISFLSGLQKLEWWCEEVIGTGVPTQHDVRVADKSFIVRIAPYTGGQINGTVLSFTNVTAFRASIDQAVYEREYAKAIVNTVADPLVILDADLRVLTANRAFYSLSRVSRDAIQGIPLNKLSNGAFDSPRLVAQLRDMLADDQPFQPLEIDREWPDDRRRTMSLYAQPCALPGHSSGMALLSFHDVTARKEAEASNSRLAAIVEYSDDAIVMTDLSGNITDWNNGAQRIFGYSGEEIIGNPITLLVPADRQNEEANILERIRRGERVETYDTTRQRKDGSLVEISVTISPVKDATGKIVGASKIARDITGRKQADEVQRFLAQEVDHRSKNLLALVQATVHFSQADTPEAIKTAIEGRINALANVHGLLAQTRWVGADLRSLVMEELSPYCPQGAERAEIDGPDLVLKPSAAQLIAVALHELTTNAVKYGALSASQGRVRVEWLQAANGKLVIRWTETNGPPVKAPTRQGFGTRVLDRAIHQLNGRMRFDWRTEGLACDIEVEA